MKKIRLVDQTEIEVFNISLLGDLLKIDILNGDASAMERIFSNEDNLAVIQYYVGTELTMGYAGYTKLKVYEKNKDQMISTDYTIVDKSTKSGFAEVRSDILSVSLLKLERVEELTVETKQLRADIDFVAMETGVIV